MKGKWVGGLLMRPLSVGGVVNEGGLTFSEEEPLSLPNSEAVTLLVKRSRKFML
jgi:hypothetical protein